MAKQLCCNVKCISCPFKRIGHWFLRQQTEMHSITSWFQTNSYDGKGFLKHKSKPPTATLELFTGQNASTALAETSTQPTNKKNNISTATVSVNNTHTPSKRQLPDKQNHNTTKQRRDTAPPCSAASVSAMQTNTT